MSSGREYGPKLAASCGGASSMNFRSLVRCSIFAPARQIHINVYRETIVVRCLETRPRNNNVETLTTSRTSFWTSSCYLQLGAASFFEDVENQDPCACRRRACIEPWDGLFACLHTAAHVHTAVNVALQGGYWHNLQLFIKQPKGLIS